MEKSKSIWLILIKGLRWNLNFWETWRTNLSKPLSGTTYLMIRGTCSFCVQASLSNTQKCESSNKNYSLSFQLSIRFQNLQASEQKSEIVPWLKLLTRKCNSLEALTLKKRPPKRATPISRPTVTQTRVKTYSISQLPLPKVAWNFLMRD